MRDVSFAELWDHLRRANPWFLLAMTAAATGTFVLRAFRWQVLLRPTVAHLGFRSRFAAVCIGFMANNLLPARLGEFARAYSLSRIEPVGMSAAFASLVVERLLDALVLVTFLLPALLLPGGGGSAGPVSLRHIAITAVVIIAAGFLVLGSLVRFPNWFLRLAERWTHRLMPQRGADRITGMLASFIAGLGSLRHAHVFAQAIGWSFVVWLWNGMSFYLGFLAFGIRGPGVGGALLLQSLIGFAVSIPSSPGFFGPFEAAARVALSVYSIAPAQIISFAAGYHILTFIPVTLMGLWYMNRLGITRDELGHSEEYVEAAVDARDGDVAAGAGDVAAVADTASMGEGTRGQPRAEGVDDTA